MSSFHERQKSLFDHLKDAEDQTSFTKTNKATIPQDFGVIDKQVYRKLKHDMKQFRGRESIFKRQDANIKECLRAKKIPDFIKNPKKWDYYSLSDVTPEQMSDSTNTATALAFIREMEEKEAVQSKMEHDFDESGLFKKPTFHISSAIKKSTVTNEKPVFKSSKVVMPEYVVGMSKKKINTVHKKDVSKDSPSTPRKVELKLNHLFEDED